VGLAILPGDTLVTTALDKTVRFAKLSSLEVNASATLDLDGSARSLSSAGDTVAVVTDAKVYVIAGFAVRTKADAAGASAVAISTDGARVAVGFDSGLIRVYDYQGSSLKQVAELHKHGGEITALAFSPTGAHLGSCDSARSVIAWDLAARQPVSTSWTAHKAKVTAIAWSPSGEILATGGVDSSLVIWSVSQPEENINMRLAHEGGVTALAFLADDLVLSAGHDACLKTWRVQI